MSDVNIFQHQSMAMAMADELLEPVLLVPPKLTGPAYALLVKHGLVARTWHLEGRFGSRTFRPGLSDNDERMGLPLLACAAERIETEQRRGSDDRCLDSEIQGLLQTPGVLLVRCVVPHPKNAPAAQHTAATVHPERAAALPALRRSPRPTAGRPPASGAFSFMELFAGIGGFGVALEALGGRCVFASEVDERCRDIFLANLARPPPLVHGDIYEVPDASFPDAGECDLLVAGFPCQPFSRLGAQPGFRDGDRGLLYTQIVRALRASRPRAFLLENVPGLADTGDALQEIVESLRGVGYDVQAEVVTARGLTAQSRKRLFFVGLLRDEDDKGNSESPSAFRFPFIPDLGLRARDILEYEDGAPSTAARSSRRGTAADDTETYRLSADQLDQLLHRSKRWKPSKLAWSDKVLDTLDGHYGVSVGKGNSQLVPGAAPRRPRLLTPRECARAQGFPAWFRLPPPPPPPREETGEDGGDGDGGVARRAYRKRLYRMFGNAVCPPVVAALAGAVLAAARPGGDATAARGEAAGKRRRGNARDWTRAGLEAAVSLALDSVLEQGREEIVRRLVTSKQMVVL